MNQKAKRALAIGAAIGGVVGLAFIVSSGSSGSGSDSRPEPEPDPGPYDPPYVPPEPDPNPAPAPARQEITTWCARWGVDPIVRDWLITCAYGESGLNPRVMLGLSVPPSARNLSPPITIPTQSATKRSAESAAALVAYNRNKAHYEGCGHPIEDYTFGSGGLFGILPGNGLAALWNTSRSCLNPVEVFAVGPSIVFALGYMKRVASGGYGWLEQGQKWGDMRIAWRRPSAVDDGPTEANKGTLSRMKEALAATHGSKYTVDSFLPRVRYTNQELAAFVDDWVSERGLITG